MERQIRIRSRNAFSIHRCHPFVSAFFHAEDSGGGDQVDSPDIRGKTASAIVQNQGHGSDKESARAGETVAPEFLHGSGDGDLQKPIKTVKFKCTSENVEGEETSSLKSGTTLEDEFPVHPIPSNKSVPKCAHPQAFSQKFRLNGCRPKSESESRLQAQIMERLKGKFVMPPPLMERYGKLQSRYRSEMDLVKSASASSNTSCDTCDWVLKSQASQVPPQTHRKKGGKICTTSSTWTDSVRLEYFQAPFRRLPTPWQRRPETPLQRIYGSAAKQVLPVQTEKERVKVMDRALLNGHMYRRIKRAQSNYNRKDQLTDFKKHEAFIRYKGPVANLENIENRRNRPVAPCYCFKPQTQGSISFIGADLLELNGEWEQEPHPLTAQTDCQSNNSPTLPSPINSSTLPSPTNHEDDCSDQ